MHTIDKDALWQGVMAAPDDDAPRLVYADYLDEHGDPAQAEFIRRQVRLYREWKTLGPGVRALETSRAAAYVRDTLRKEAGLPFDPGNVISGLFRSFVTVGLRSVTASGPTVVVTKKTKIGERFCELGVSRGFVSYARLPMSLYMQGVLFLFARAPMTDVRTTDRHATTRVPMRVNGHDERMYGWLTAAYRREDGTLPPDYRTEYVGNAFYLPRLVFNTLKSMKLHDGSHAGNEYGDGYDALGWRHKQRADEALAKCLVRYGRDTLVQPVGES